MTARVPTNEQGFSLIEVLAAAAVFAIVSALSVGLLVSALRSEEQSELVLSEVGDVHRVASLLRDDIGQLVPRPVRNGEGLVDPRVFAADINGTETIRSRSNDPHQIIVLTRAGWANPGRLQPRSSLQRVAWVLDGDSLYREVWAYPDAAAQSEPRRQLLIAGIRAVEVDVLTAGQWINTARVVAGAEGQSEQPDAVRLRYTLPRLGQMEHVVLSPAAEARL